MISANELRIGNWVTLNGKHHVVRVSTFLMCNHLHPIPLTPELLERCGFVKEGILYQYGKFSIAFGDTIITDNGRTYFNSWAILDHSPKYLHQIQNIYHALTGNELEVKP